MNPHHAQGKSSAGTSAKYCQRFFVPAIAAPTANDLIAITDLESSERARDVTRGTAARASVGSRHDFLKNAPGGVSMFDTDTGVRVAGAWMAIASVLLAGVLIGHGPIDPHMSAQMEVIAEASVRWAIVHWAAAAALSLFAFTGLIVLTARSRLTREWWTLSAWGIITVGALWTMTTAVAEATVVTNAAAAGDIGRFEAWWAFSEGKATGFMFLALAVAVIAGNEATSARSARAATPVWASWIAMVAGTGSFLGWPLGMWFGINFGSILWIVSSLVMSAWTLWFGLGLMKSNSG